VDLLENEDSPIHRKRKHFEGKGCWAVWRGLKRTNAGRKRKNQIPLMGAETNGWGKGCHYKTRKAEKNLEYEIPQPIIFNNAKGFKIRSKHEDSN